jgi:hypothetical protein
MVYLQNGFENGFNGLAISSVNSGSGTDDLFDIINPVAGGTNNRFSGARQAHGELSGQVSTSGSGGICNFGWSTSLGTVSTIYGRFYINPTAVATTSDLIVKFASSGTAGGGIRYDTAGKLSIVNPGGTVTQTAASALTLNSWARVEWQLVCGSSGSASLAVNVYQAAAFDTTTISYTLTDTASAFGVSGSVNQITFGWNTSNINQPSLYFDDLALLDSGFVGPWYVAPTYPVFPLNPLGVTVQLLLNGSLADITGLVYQTNDIQITGRGSPSETESINPVTMTLTLNNTGGAFTPNNSGSPFYPYITGNTRIFVSVNSQSITGVVYSGYRFIGEVSNWPPSWDPTGNYIYVNVIASGILTRYIQGNNIGSPLKRFYTRKTDVTTPIAYWPCEELTGATNFQNIESGGSTMTWTGTPGLSSDSGVPGSDPIPQLNGSVWTGNTGSQSWGGPVTWNTPGNYQWLCPGGTTTLTSVSATGGGAGGSNGVHVIAGGGGESAADSSVAVTPGNYYNLTVGAGGGGGRASGTTAYSGAAGGNSFFQADSVTTLAHGAGTSGVSATNGGTGSQSAVHHNGGNGGIGNVIGGGGGGGGSGGTFTGGLTGGSTSGNSGGAGATAVSGGGKGGKGETFQTALKTYTANLAGIGGFPGGGGGSGSNQNKYAPKYGPGAQGASGQVTINFAGVSTPNNVILRFVTNVPATGMPNGAVLARGIVASGTLARIECYYVSSGGGLFGLRGYNSGSSLIFDTGTGAMPPVNGTGPWLVSMELAVNGSSVNCTIFTVAPNSAVPIGIIIPYTGSIGAISSVVINPNGNIQDTAVGHIVLQGALEYVAIVSPAFGGFAGELAIDRFKRICSEEGIRCAYQGDGYWNWNSILPYQNTYSTIALGGWTSSNSTLSSCEDYGEYESNFILIANSGTASGAIATSPQIPVPAGQYVSAYIDLNTLGQAGNYNVIITYFKNNGATNGTATLLSAVSFPSPFSTGTISITQCLVPANTTSMNLAVYNTATPTFSGQQFAIGNVSIGIGVRMGPQPDDTFMSIMQQIQDVDCGVLVEPRWFCGIEFVSRVAMIDNDPSLALNYTSAQVAQNIQPVFDQQQLRNNITLSRINGSSVNVQLQNGPLSVATPPAGVGNYPYSLSGNFYADSQLAQCAAWKLDVGTVNDFRYKSIALDQTRPEVSSLFAQQANLDDGQRINIFNVPSFMPSSNIDQIVSSLDESLNAFKWEIDVTGVPYVPYATNIDTSGDFWNTGLIGSWSGTNCSVLVTSTIASPYNYYLQCTTSANGGYATGATFPVLPGPGVGNPNYMIYWAINGTPGAVINMGADGGSGFFGTNITLAGPGWSFGSLGVTTTAFQTTMYLTATPTGTFPVTFQIGYFICVPVTEALSW